MIALEVCNANVLEDNSLSLDHLANTTLGPEGISDQDIISEVYINGKKKIYIALETATFTAFNDSCSSMPVRERDVGALLDSGAQRTIITSETVNKSGFQVVDHKAATLQVFGNHKPFNRIYDIVKVLCKVGSKPIPSFAVVVKNLGPIPMVGTCSMAE